MTPRPTPTLVLDSGIKVLLLTAVTYESAFIYEAFYVAHFGVPVAFVDVTLHELLLCGVACLFVIGLIIWLDIFWSAKPSKMPPRLAQALMTLFLLSIGLTVLCALLNAPLALGAGLISTFVFTAAALLLIPLIRHRRLPKIASRYWATFGDDRSEHANAPSILWFSVSRGMIVTIATLVVTGVFSLAIGTWRARAQTDFAILDLSDNCAVLRLSSDGYLCVGIDFQKRVALGTFRFLDPKDIELHIVRVGPIASFQSSRPLPAMRAAAP
jgi:hypothetical protein